MRPRLAITCVGALSAGCASAVANLDDAPRTSDASATVTTPAVRDGVRFDAITTDEADAEDAPRRRVVAAGSNYERPAWVACIEAR